LFVEAFDLGLAASIATGIAIVLIADQKQDAETGDWKVWRA
jgi:hypothetical protein